MALDHDEVVNWCGGQTKASCATHQQHFLIREGIHSRALCCERRCNKPVRWCCPEGFSSDYQCAVGLCFRHMKPLQHREQVTLVQPRAPPDIPRTTLHPPRIRPNLPGGTMMSANLSQISLITETTRTLRSLSCTPLCLTVWLTTMFH